MQPYGLPRDIEVSCFPYLYGTSPSRTEGGSKDRKPGIRSSKSRRRTRRMWKKRERTHVRLSLQAVIQDFNPTLEKALEEDYDFEYYTGGYYTSDMEEYLVKLYPTYNPDFYLEEDGQDYYYLEEDDYELAFNDWQQEFKS